MAATANGGSGARRYRSVGHDTDRITGPDSAPGDRRGRRGDRPGGVRRHHHRHVQRGQHLPRSGPAVRHAVLEPGRFQRPRHPYPGTRRLPVQHEEDPRVQPHPPVGHRLRGRLRRHPDLPARGQRHHVPVGRQHRRGVCKRLLARRRDRHRRLLPGEAGHRGGHRADLHAAHRLRPLHLPGGGAGQHAVPHVGQRARLHRRRRHGGPGHPDRLRLGDQRQLLRLHRRHQRRQRRREPAALLHPCTSRPPSTRPSRPPAPGSTAPSPRAAPPRAAARRSARTASAQRARARVPTSPSTPPQGAPSAPRSASRT